MIFFSLRIESGEESLCEAYEEESKSSMDDFGISRWDIERD